ncbi:MAG: hypothetical protein J4F34_07775 [Gemmatimonadetes bacterium]|nr:hypothetical protein [Gemmatimonadota bacterium]
MASLPPPTGIAPFIGAATAAAHAAWPGEPARSERTSRRRPLLAATVLARFLRLERQVTIPAYEALQRPDGLGERS